MSSNQLRYIPAVHMIQSDPRFERMIDEHYYSYKGLTRVFQDHLDEIRCAIIKQEWNTYIKTKEAFMDLIFENVETYLRSSNQLQLKSVINATGIILHTNLGRARLSERAIAQMTKVARHYSNLEYNVTEGERGSRHDLVESLICDVTGAEAAMVVNNNAAAVYMVLRTFALGKKVIVSRGELIEIGGSFRVSSIMEESGALLKEVGTTNKTHLKDYQEAIDEETSILMKVHSSNFKIVGFTKSVPTQELVCLAKDHEQLFTYEDLGSGALYPLKDCQIGEEPLVRDVIQSGVNLVTFSGDKLLGGPQAGIIAGSKRLIDELKKHQLARVLRVDKFTLAALGATLHSYKYTQIQEIPVLRDILKSEDTIREEAFKFIASADHIKGLQFDIEASVSKIGGGTMPEVELPTYVISMEHDSKSSEELFKLLREADVPIICRIKGDQILFDFRTVTIEEQAVVLKMLKQRFLR